MTASVDWIVEHFSGTAAELHEREVPDDGHGRVWILDAIRPAVVLGSTQSCDDVDPEAAARLGVDVVRRRSGGGAVWVDSRAMLWIDVVAPRAVSWWTDDVGRSFAPVGEVWRRVLDRLVPGESTGGSGGSGGLWVHRGRLERTDWSDQVCFAGVGPGEVFVGSRRSPSKVVGISQRRTRVGSRFQCGLCLDWNPAPLLALLTAPIPPAALDSVGHGIGRISPTVVADSLSVELAALETGWDWADLP